MQASQIFCTYALFALKGDMESAAAAISGDNVHEAAWQSTITRISSAIVNIRISSVRSIEAVRASYGYATGFVGEWLELGGAA